MDFLTSNAIFTLTLHLQRLYIDALVTNKASAGNASVWLAETFLTGPKNKINIKSTLSVPMLKYKHLLI